MGKSRENNLTGGGGRETLNGPREWSFDLDLIEILY